MAPVGCESMIIPPHLLATGGPNSEVSSPDDVSSARQVVSDDLDSQMSNEEDDTILEQEEQSLIMEEQAEQEEKRMFTMALVNSVVETKGPSPKKNKPQMEPTNSAASTNEKHSKELLQDKHFEKLLHPEKVGSSSVKTTRLSQTKEKGYKQKNGVWQGTRKRKRDSSARTPTSHPSSPKKPTKNIENQMLLVHPHKYKVMNPILSSSPPSAVSLTEEEAKEADEGHHRPSSPATLQTATKKLQDSLTTGDALGSSPNAGDLPSSTPENQVPAVTFEDSSASVTSFNLGEDSNSITQSSRKRIFSIDLDASGFDLDGSTVAFSSGVGPIDASEDNSTSVLPPVVGQPIATSNNTEVVPYGIPSLSSTNVAKDMNTHAAALATAADGILSGAEKRDRGMSFELFSFGVNENEPLPPTPASLASLDSIPQQLQLQQTSIAALTRPRGDSIIFDPVSFSDGGIHEENALSKTRRNSISLEETEEIAIMNTSGFGDGSTSSNGSSAPVLKTEFSAQLSVIGETVSSVPQQQQQQQHQQSSVSNVQSASTTSAPVIVPSSLNGTPTAQVPCPMDLINKGGRIGIYLPEARKARIAKFHSKRKMRIWRKRIKYDCRKKLADSRPRIKGRFVKRSDIDEEEE